MISILGGGSWGPALGIHLARQGHQIKIWEFMEDRVKEMQSGVCPLLNNIPLPKTITISTNMQETLADTDLVLIAVPSSNLEATIKQAAPFLQKQPIIICSKGFGSGLRACFRRCIRSVWSDSR
jgi:glycerol-3-phosphate dehydrogenase (NAD(P)+)